MRWNFCLGQLDQKFRCGKTLILNELIGGTPGRIYVAYVSGSCQWTVCWKSSRIVGHTGEKPTFRLSVFNFEESTERRIARGIAVENRSGGACAAVFLVYLHVCVSFPLLSKTRSDFFFIFGHSMIEKRQCTRILHYLRTRPHERGQEICQDRPVAESGPSPMLLFRLCLVKIDMHAASPGISLAI